VARWREIRAAELDIPVRHVLSDMVILGIAAKAPRNELDLAQTRGIDRRQASGATGASILAAVATGAQDGDQGDLHFPTPDGDDLDRSLRPAVTLVSAWITELARQQDLDAVLLGTRQDIVDLLRHAPNPRLATGWRADIVGRDVQNLLEGRVGLTFRSAEAGGGLELQPISDPHRTP
jgi:ribonuclease D